MEAPPQVDPMPFYEACVQDSCSCDAGGDCECFCSAVASYAQECTKEGACVFWRTPDLCRECPPALAPGSRGVQTHSITISLSVHITGQRYGA